MSRLLLFWDYDTQWGADRSRVARSRHDWGGDEFECTDRLLELLATYRIRSCFAVVGAAAMPGRRPYHDPVQIRRIHAAGHEIASHSQQHDWLPGLGAAALRENLRASRLSLEACIGAPVRCFVPPYNQPYDCVQRWSISLGERREAGSQRTDLWRLCEALRETGYATARVFYFSLYRRVVRAILRRRVETPGQTEQMAGITCVRLNTPCGFGDETMAMLERCVATGGTAVVYAHPHSLRTDGPQHERHLTTFLQRAAQLRDSGHLEVGVPADLATAC